MKKFYILNTSFCIFLLFATICQGLSLINLQHQIDEIQLSRKEENPIRIWLDHSLREMFHLNVQNYQSSVEKAQNAYLSESGYESYLRILKTLNFPDALKKMNGSSSIEFYVPLEVHKFVHGNMASGPLYDVPVELTISDNRDWKSKDNFTLEVFVYDTYTDSGYKYLIGDIKILKPPSQDESH